MSTLGYLSKERRKEKIITLSDKNVSSKIDLIRVSLRQQIALNTFWDPWGKAWAGWTSLLNADRGPFVAFTVMKQDKDKHLILLHKTKNPSQ